MSVDLWSDTALALLPLLCLLVNSNYQVYVYISTCKREKTSSFGTVRLNLTGMELVWLPQAKTNGQYLIK